MRTRAPVELFVDPSVTAKRWPRCFALDLASLFTGGT